jgi:FtsP/CotA-like multicopper oxidase with cupredoxin domain/sugar lactone lactonase YvrE
MKTCTPRDIFLQIEPLADYSPLAPLLCARRYGRDCQLNEGHELGRIPADEILEASVDAVVYREYLDPDYATPNTAPLVPSDTTEPPWNRRVPGAVIWARPGEQLRIHVRNADPLDCHSFHLHGLRYGIDSDGAWPRGVAYKDGRRSDEILPGESWTYVFDITEEMIGAWPFHDHVRDVQANINRGLFGGLIVRDPKAPRVDHEVPLFVHAMADVLGHCKFESKTLSNGEAFHFTFPDAGEICDYICRIHGASMAGRVRVVAGTPSAVPVDIKIEDNKFTPPDITITAGTEVVWTNHGSNQHIVFAGGGGNQTFCLNGRAYVGNTPIIAGNSGEALRWYLFNLDVGSVWHNFHPHSARWQLPAPPAGASDVHALSPVEAFVIDTEVPPALRLPCELEQLQCCPPRDACRITVCADFLFHCHIEEHMMSGLAGLVRAQQKLWITDAALKQTELVLPMNCCGTDCAWVDLKRCFAAHRPQMPMPGGGDHTHDTTMGGMQMHDAPAPAPVRAHDHDTPTPAPAPLPASPASVFDLVPEHILMVQEHIHMLGPMPEHMPPPEPMIVPAQPALDPVDAAKNGYWEMLPCEAPILTVHAALMRTGKILFFAGSGNDELYTTGFRSAVYDYENGGFTMPPTPTDVFCAGQTILPDGRVLVAGGTQRYDPFVGLSSALLFDPISEQWTFVHSMKNGRWYPTLMTLGDGRGFVASGGGSPENEIYSNPTGWSVAGPGIGWPLYPHLHLLKDGRAFHSGMRLGGSGMQPGFLNPITGAYASLPAAAVPPGFNFGARDQGATVLLPPAQDQKIMVMGGGNPSINAVHIIDTDAPTPKYVAAPSMLRNRIHVNAVILPDRTVVATGGSGIAEDALTASTEAEIYDPATNTWTTGARARVPRMYHSVALLLPDARVLTAGSNPSRRNDEMRLEIYHPPYLFRGPRPCIEQAPEQITLGASFTVHAPNAGDIKWISLVRPMATTHSYDSDQRLIDIPFRRSGVCKLNAHMPENPNLVPPGYYMLFVVNQRGVPSVASWVHVLAPVKPPEPKLKRGDIVVGTGNRVVRVDPVSAAASVITEGGDIQNALGIAFDAHPHIVVVTDSGKVIHVVPASGAQHVILHNGWLFQDAAVRADGMYAVVNLPSATPSGLFLVDHDNGTITKFNTGTHFGDGPTGVVIGKDGHFYVSHLGTPMVLRVDKNTGAETVVSQGGHLISPSGIALSKDGHLLVVDFGADAVIHVDPANGHQHVISSGGHLKSPVDIAVDPNGRILVVDMAGDKLIRIEPTTGAQTVLAQGGLLAGIRSVEVFGVA